MNWSLRRPATWQVALLLLLTSLLAGAGNLFASDNVDDPCADDCDWGKNCPPNCSQGACAKVTPTVKPASVALVVTALEQTPNPAPTPGCQAPEPVLDTVFHPPRL